MKRSDKLQTSEIQCCITVRKWSSNSAVRILWEQWSMAISLAYLDCLQLRLEQLQTPQVEGKPSTKKAVVSPRALSTWKHKPRHTSPLLWHHQNTYSWNHTEISTSSSWNETNFLRYVSICCDNRHFWQDKRLVSTRSNTHTAHHYGNCHWQKTIAKCSGRTPTFPSGCRTATEWPSIARPGRARAGLQLPVPAARPRARNQTTAVISGSVGLTSQTASKSPFRTENRVN
jgi:hypothetical protein